MGDNSAYIFGILLCISVPGLALAVLRPQAYKFLFRRLARSTFLVPLFALLISVSLVGARWESKRSVDPPQSTTPDLSPVTKGYLEQLKSAPQTGPLTYEIATSLTPGSPPPERITVITPEKTADRLTQVNDQVLERLKRDNIVNEKTERYFVDYFDDQAAASNYFAIQAKSSASVDEKQASQLHYSAIFIYNKPSKTIQLFHLVTNKIVKQY